MKTVQVFSEKYLENCRKLSADDIVRFLDDFRRLHAGEKTPSKHISMRTPELLLETFKFRCVLSGVRYQTQIKALMQEWVESN